MTSRTDMRNFLAYSRARMQGSIPEQVLRAGIQQSNQATAEVVHEAAQTLFAQQQAAGENLRSLTEEVAQEQEATLRDVAESTTELTRVLEESIAQQQALEQQLTSAEQLLQQKAAEQDQTTETLITLQHTLAQAQLYQSNGEKIINFLGDAALTSTGFSAAQSRGSTVSAHAVNQLWASTQ